MLTQTSSPNHPIFAKVNVVIKKPAGLCEVPRQRSDLSAQRLPGSLFLACPKYEVAP